MKRFWMASLVAALAISLFRATPGVAMADSLTVPTTSGMVRGLTERGVDQWRGVPYAAPPLDELRWRAPAPVPPWTGVRATTTFAPECLQPTADEPVGSEDCLYLNVFAPEATPSEARLPVMVHLHGGGNWASHPYTNADAFVRHGVIVVTLAYRLGVFGFVGHPALSAEASGSSGEYGVLDQIAALHWVKDNIAAFGGDPNNVTLFGESSGSFDAVAIAASPHGTGLFAQLAAQTETFWPGRGVDTIADAEEIGVSMANAVGCSGATDVAACLRAQPADALVSAVDFINAYPRVGGVVLPASPLKLIAGQPDPVPMLVGSNREEAAGDFPKVVAQDTYTFASWLRDSNTLVGPQNAPEARELYPPSAYDSLFWAAVAMTTDAVYTCPMRGLALATNGPVYRYLFTHRYQNDPYLALGRATHFFDDPLLWHDPDLLSGLGYNFSPSEEVLSARMTAYWTNFAKTGDPNGAGLPTWPRYTAATEKVTVLDEPTGQLSFYQREQCGLLDSLPTILDNARYYTPHWMPSG